MQDAVRAKKLAYKRMLSQGTEGARLAYKEPKKEAKSSVRRAKNEEWIRLGEEMERDSKRSQRSFWASIKAEGARDN